MEQKKKADMDLRRVLLRLNVRLCTDFVMNMSQGYDETHAIIGMCLIYYNSLFDIWKIKL